MFFFYLEFIATTSFNIVRAGYDSIKQSPDGPEHSEGYTPKAIGLK